MSKSRTTTGKAYVAHEETIDIHQILAVKHLERLWHGCNLRNIECEDGDLTELAQDRVQGNAFLNWIRGVKVPLKQLRNY
jgi:hypothetical protein